MSTHPTESTLEPKVESADAGPKLAEAETTLATNPLHGDETPVKKEESGAPVTEEKKDAASVCVFESLLMYCHSRNIQNLRSESFD